MRALAEVRRVLLRWVPVDVLGIAFSPCGGTAVFNARAEHLFRCVVFAAQRPIIA
jgi:hypothetical protein